MKKSIKIIAISFGILCIALAFAVVINLNNFPAPGGKYGVGMLRTYLRDEARSEPNSKTGEQRELALVIWYPTDFKVTQPCCRYDADALDSVQEFMSFSSGVPQWLFRGLHGTKIFARDKQPISQTQKQYPVIIMPCPPGPVIQNYSWITEELASHGYIVIGVNHPYLAARTRLPGARTIKGLYQEKSKQSRAAVLKWKATMDSIAIEDIHFLLDSLPRLNDDAISMVYRKLDQHNIGICAHSRAGAWAIDVCRSDPRIKAGMVLDSVPRGSHATDPISTPLFILFAGKSRVWHGPEGKHDYESVMKLIKASDPAIAFGTIPDVGHAVFTDVPVLLHETLMTNILSYFIQVDLNASAPTALGAIKLIKSKIVTFFNGHLT